MREGRCHCGACYAWTGRASAGTCFCGRAIVPATLDPDDVVICYWRGYPGDKAGSNVHAESRLRGTGPLLPSRALEERDGV